MEQNTYFKCDECVNYKYSPVYLDVIKIPTENKAVINCANHNKEEVFYAKELIVAHICYNFCDKNGSTIYKGNEK